MKLYFVTLFIFVMALSSCTTLGLKKSRYDYSKMDRPTRLAHYRVEKFLDGCVDDADPVLLSRYTRIDSIVIDYQSDHLHVYLNRFLSFIPFRQESTARIYDELQYDLGRRFAAYDVSLYTMVFPVEDLIPNYYRSDLMARDTTRDARQIPRPVPVVRRISHPWQPALGLNDRNIALWHSHGWYYENRLNRWEWQRARLFQTVEDLGPMSFTIPYLIPMLENAGAMVFVPRERDVQTNEVIVDNDSTNAGYEESGVGWQNGYGPGFAVGNPPYGEGDNPFYSGSYRRIAAGQDTSAVIKWLPRIPETGDYGVYISYSASDSNVTDARYSVYHSGGRTDFLVNQQVGGGTWIYLGNFKFPAGVDSSKAMVVLSGNGESPGKYITADAVRFGGGMGNIERNGMTSGRPRYMEGARYYLQYAGMPDTLVYSINGGQSDYKDDYQSRGEWVNYLTGAPLGPNRDRQVPGLGIPVDLSLAFHTDAGITKNDTVIGTLSIYSTWDSDSALTFPDGVSRLANRDWADILQTQLVEDLRRSHDPVWNRRGLWDRQYSEAFRPNVPSALLELLSHQNFLDMKFALDPRFRFDVSRSIYKAMLRFISDRNQQEYVIQPLPVDHFQALLSGENEITLRWQPREDPLEPGAAAEKYIVYQRIEDNAFDNGTLVEENEYILTDIQPGVIYSFKVTAVNSGGESFPSEILAVCRVTGQDPVLIINGFDRISGPAGIEAGGFQGFADFVDMGVPDRVDISYTGRQFNFNPGSAWEDDDAPGFGASYADRETTVIPGNSFDFPVVHGRALRAAGKSFVSASDEAVMTGQVSMTDYKLADLILGEEKETPGPKPFYGNDFVPFPAALCQAIGEFCSAGGNLIVSGAYVGSGVYNALTIDSTAIKLAGNTLKYRWRTDHAVVNGNVHPVHSAFDSLGNFSFNTGYDTHLYTVEAPDAIEPADPDAQTILRYSENNTSAAVAYKKDYGVIVTGFPLETIIGDDQRARVMKMFIRYLEQ